MLRALILLLALAGPAAAAAVPAGIPLWEGAETGMTTEEVLQAFPEATPVPKGERAGKEGPAGGELRVTIERVALGPDPYAARFYFGRSGLQRVILDRHLEGDMAFSRGLKLAGRVRDAMSEHYGEPVTRETGGDGYMVTWRQDAKRVRLVVITQSYEVKSFQVVYEPRPQD
ncbi:hypothetical protein [Thiohalorhabdus sp.]|uniref:hypothetical protein n=1 Tax=Thiohalorhabdus sp. TaxID=3094134 RepID=UPI002FC35EAC